jgi:8-oxo-dGTP diphosphatase
MTDELREKYLEIYLKKIAKQVIDDTDPEKHKGLRELARECSAVAHRSRLLTGDIATFYGNYILLVKRNKDANLYPDFWALPGGHVNEGESEFDAAIREHWEETGLVPETLHHVGRIQIPDRYPTDLWVNIAKEQKQPRGGDDCYDAAWFPIHDVQTGSIKLAFNHNKLVRLAIVEYEELRNA